MIDYHFRKYLPRYTEHLIRFYNWTGISPNGITFLSVAAAFLSAMFLSQEKFITAIIFWWLGRLLDGTDGIYARATGQTSHFGAHIDIISDMASYSIMILAFDHVFPNFHLEWMTVLFLYVLCITGALSLGTLQDKCNKKDHDNRGLRLATGLAEGGETGIAYTVFILFPSILIYSLRIWIGILIITVITRVFLAYKELR